MLKKFIARIFVGFCTFIVTPNSTNYAPISGYLQHSSDSDKLCDSLKQIYLAQDGREHYLKNAQCNPEYSFISGRLCFDKRRDSLVLDDLLANTRSLSFYAYDNKDEMWLLSPGGMDVQRNDRYSISMTAYNIHATRLEETIVDESRGSYVADEEDYYSLYGTESGYHQQHTDEYTERHHNHRGEDDDHHREEGGGGGYDDYLSHIGNGVRGIVGPVWKAISSSLPDFGGSYGGGHQQDRGFSSFPQSLDFENYGGHQHPSFGGGGGGGERQYISERQRRWEAEGRLPEPEDFETFDHLDDDDHNHDQQYQHESASSSRKNSASAPSSKSIQRQLAELSDDDGTPEEGNCAICQSGFAGENGFILRWGHIFHRSCLDEMKASGRETCPVCQYPDIETGSIMNKTGKNKKEKEKGGKGKGNKGKGKSSWMG